MRGLGRRLRQTFGISAPRMAVRTHLSWKWKLPALIALLLVIAGMWWWGFDFGQLLGGFNRKEIDARIDRLESERATLSAENAQLRDRQSSLESDLKMAQCAQASLSRQALDLQSENSQIKEELAFLQKLFSDTGKEGTFTIQRLTASVSVTTPITSASWWSGAEIRARTFPDNSHCRPAWFRTAAR